MKLKKWARATIAALFVSSFVMTSVVNAETTRNIEDESIYDLLVDRYFNGSNQNDYETSSTDSTQFAGGDFIGIANKISRISDMGFTIISLGSVFSTETYDGSMVTSYSQFERHFGTAEDFEHLIETSKKNGISVMIDFPLTNVSKNHEWAQDPSKKDWIVGTSNNKVRWDLKNKEVQQALIDAVVKFVSTYKVGGVRLTNLDIADTDFLNTMIKEIKKVDEQIYVISNEESDANFDASFYNETNETFRNIYKNIDLDSSNLLKYIEPFVQQQDKPTQLMLDTIWTNRFTLSAEEENMYIPTRLKLGVAATLLLPGVPVMQYGTEIAMNGVVGPESHQLYNFKTNDELVKYIGDIQILRNQSETLRSGEFSLIKNENGLLAFKRSSDEEQWIVFINNTGKTARINVTEEDIGKNKEIHGLFDGETIRADETGVYPIVLNREKVEVYEVTEKRGINISYLVALSLVYILFIGFIVLLWKRSKRSKVKS